MKKAVDKCEADDNIMKLSERDSKMKTQRASIEKI